MNHIITRLSDVLVMQAWSSPNTPTDTPAQLATIATQYGGVSTDYQYQAVQDATYADVLARRAAGKAVYLAGETVTDKGAPTLTLETFPNEDKRLTCDVGNIAFTGEVKWECTAPDEVTVHEGANAIAGVETWDITPGQIGMYAIRVTVLNYGFAEVSFEEG